MGAGTSTYIYGGLRWGTSPGPTVQAGTTTWRNLNVDQTLGRVMCVGTDNHIYWSQSTVEFAKGTVFGPMSQNFWKSAAFDNSGKVWAVGQDGHLYWVLWDSLLKKAETWVKVGAYLWNSIAILEAQIWAIGADNKLYMTS